MVERGAERRLGNVPVKELCNAKPMLVADGAGYPQGLRGDVIPLEARIVAVADAYDAMTNDRPYRRALSPLDAAREIARGAGTQFDPTVVRAFMATWNPDEPVKSN